MKYKINPAKGGKHSMEKVIDLGGFLVLSSSVFKVILHYWNFSTYFSGTKGFYIHVLWGFFFEVFFLLFHFCFNLHFKHKGPVFLCCLDFGLAWFLTLCCHFCAFKVGIKCYQNRKAVFHISFEPGSEGINLNIEYKV